MRTATSHGRRVLRSATIAGAAVLVVPASASAAVTVADRQVTEGNAPGTVTFTFVREAPALSPAIVVNVATQDGSATAPGDYSVTKGTVPFPATLFGATQRVDVSVPIIGDTVHEPGEAFGLRLSGPEVANPLALAFIVDDDPAPPAAPPPAGAALPQASAPPIASAPVVLPRIGLAPPRLRRPSLVRVTIACPVALGRCSGTLTVRSRAERRSRFKSLRRARTLGRRTFDLRAGETQTLGLRLKGRNLELLDAARRLRVQARVNVTDQAGRRSTRRASGTLVARLSPSD